MLQRVTLDGIQLPRLYIAENQNDVDVAMSNGIPFIRWSKGQDALIRILLRPTLEKMFPHIKWDNVLGRRRPFETQVELYGIGSGTDQTELGISLDEGDEDAIIGLEESDEIEAFDDDLDIDLDDDEILSETADITTDERVFSGGGGDMIISHKLDLEDYMGDMSSYVDLEVLQRLKLMPKFIGDILDCIKINVGSGLFWREGYNKRLGIPVGRFNASGQLPNLIILDVSGSIPRGISATMISLIDTLRTQLSADLIITSSHSRFYPMGSELPDPQRIRDMFSYGNEAAEFWGILSTYIRGRHYGHVFSFGDNDTPDYFNYHQAKGPVLEGTIVEHVHHYHTGKFYETGVDMRKTGYAKWCHMLGNEPLVEYDTSWCNVIRK